MNSSEGSHVIKRDLETVDSLNYVKKKEIIKNYVQVNLLTFQNMMHPLQKLYTYTGRFSCLLCLTLAMRSAKKVGVD